MSYHENASIMQAPSQSIVRAIPAPTHFSSLSVLVLEYEKTAKQKKDQAYIQACITADQEKKIEDVCSLSYYLPNTIKLEP